MRQSIFSIAAPVWAFLFVASTVFEQRAVVPISIVFALVCLARGSILEAFRQSRDLRLFAAGLAALVVWSGVTLLWAPQQDYAISTFAKFVGNCVVGIVICAAVLRMNPEPRRRMCLAAIVGGAFAAAYLFANLVTSGAVDEAIFGYTYRPQYGFFWLKPAAALVSFVAWAAVLLAWRRRSHFTVGAAILVAIAALGYAIGFNAIVPALLAGGGAAILATIFKRKAPFIMLVPILLVFAVAPLPLQHINASMLMTPEQTTGGVMRSAMHRLLIWEFVSHRVADRPATGFGLGASKYFGETEKMHDTRHKYFREVIPVHPHNGALHIWLEMGGIGLVLVALLMFQTMRAVASPAYPDDARAVACGLFATGTVYFLISYGIWSSWWQQYLWFAAALAIALTHAGTERNRDGVGPDRQSGYKAPAI